MPRGAGGTALHASGRVPLRRSLEPPARRSHGPSRAVTATATCPTGGQPARRLSRRGTSARSAPRRASRSCAPGEARRVDRPRLLGREGSRRTSRPESASGPSLQLRAQLSTGEITRQPLWPPNPKELERVGRRLPGPRLPVDDVERDLRIRLLVTGGRRDQLVLDRERPRPPPRPLRRLRGRAR